MAPASVRTVFSGLCLNSPAPHRLPVAAGPAGRAGGAPESGDAAGARLGRGGAGQSQRGRAPRRDAPDPADREEGVAGGLAAARGHADGPDHALGRRHAGQGAPALRQGAPAGARRTCSRRWGPRSSRSGSPRSASTTASWRRRWRRSRDRHSGRGGVHRISGGALALRAAARRDPRLGGRGRGGDRHRHHPGPRADRELARALRRGARHARGLRRRPHQDDPRHRRARHPAQRGAAPAWCA